MLTRNKRKFETAYEENEAGEKKIQEGKVIILSTLDFFNGTVANNSQAVSVVDIRTTDEFEQGHLINSESFPLSSFRKKQNVQLHYASHDYPESLYVICSELDKHSIEEVYQSLVKLHGWGHCKFLSSFSEFVELVPFLIESGPVVMNRQTYIQFPSMIKEWGLFLGSFSVAKDSQVLSCLQIDVIINVARECKHEFELIVSSLSSTSSSKERKKKTKDFYHCQKDIVLVKANNRVIDYHKFFCSDSIDEHGIEEMWKQVATLIKECHQGKKRVLVHCAKGKSRSASAIIYYLMKEENIPFHKAHDYVKKCRPEISVDNFSFRLLNCPSK
jgi:rhodanese-related sulfurtransferase